MTKEHGNAKELDWSKLDGLLQFKPTLKVCADFLDLSPKTIENKIREKYDCTFSEYRDRQMGTVKVKLQQKAIQMALEGHATMLIFSLKNLCGWSDKVEEVNIDGGKLSVEGYIRKVHEQEAGNKSK